MLSDPASTLRVSLATEYDDIEPDFYRTISLRGSVTSLEVDLPFWKPENPILLEFLTGSGKTTCVYNRLLPDAMAKGKNLLLVSNRVALSTQQKRRVMELTNDPKLRLLSEDGIKEAEDFGSVRVITYHRLPALCNDESAARWISNLAYVVFDESHFFTSDVVFNENTEYFLRLSCERFYRAVRIYLTGTNWDILKPLAEAELKYYRPIARRPYFYFPPVREFIRYTIPEDYNKHSFHFFRSLSELIPHIHANPSSKWVIFADSKASSKDFCHTLGNNICEYLDSESKGTESWASIVKNKQFTKQALIATAVLDNGVDNIDAAVKNIAIIADNRTTLLQMAGRKRLEAGEQVNLWICDLPRRTISTRHAQYEKYLAWFDEYERYANAKDYNAFVEKVWRCGDQAIFKLFRFSWGIVCPNKLAQYVLKRRRLFFGRILDRKTSFKTEVES